ncbi:MULTISPECIES: hypothetical protein [unclassified Janthinobacterium]|uniref:hypothetical protein n=1 Tax=unclassified Janthinobacterium TaxID=2610881 RepID=UPI00088CEDEA|nr:MULTISPECIES: hypothetical protein [unclassified Janthinobacterium]SDA74568.1 hypothetical protein SAMN03159349_03962 [Janthinobacterium sp. 551a]SFB58536.1 hypothetical protein SAMN03159300_108155 [Janthinobacterium sp. 344]
MLQLLTALLRFVLRHALQFALFIVILLAGRLLLAEWRAYSAGSDAVAALRQATVAADQHGASLAGTATARVNALRHASHAAIAARLAQVQAQLTALRARRQPSLFTLPLPDADALARHAQDEATRRVEIEVLAQEARYLLALQAVLNADDARQTLARLHAQHVQAYAALQENVRQRQLLAAQHPLAAHLPGSDAYAQMARLEAEGRRLRESNQQAYNAWLAQRARTSDATHTARPAPFSIDEQGLANALAPVQQAIAAGEAQLARNWIGRWRAPVMDVAPTAALLVLSAIALPAAIKAFFYFVLAPIAARVKPLSIARELQVAGSTLPLPPHGESRISAVSQALQLQPGQRMLIHPEYLQSSPVSTHKRTQWLLDWSFPFTSLAAGMVALTRLHSGAPACVTISASDDPLMEIAVVRLPAGGALVFQPRGLVGLILDAGQPLAMSSHWRLGSLHAWLTLQLRFIVFRGPATLIVRGCRGVRLERAGQGRSISQSATLGFTTDVLYSTLRSETFIPYLRGQQALLNDRFDGDNGVYLYEETPRHGKQPGKAGSWFEGFTDAILKVFGI